VVVVGGVVVGGVVGAAPDVDTVDGVVPCVIIVEGTF
jgi:hypothetical protein